jgi:hypothetical protein
MFSSLPLELHLAAPSLHPSDAVLWNKSSTRHCNPRFRLTWRRVPGRNRIWIVCWQRKVRTGTTSRILTMILTSSAEGGLGLCKIALNQQLDLSIRQSAAILISQYIKKYWSGVFPQFVGPWPSEEIKKPIREALVAGLHDPASKIRSAIVSTAFGLHVHHV